ncbi:hypothetical protein VSU19_21290 [Verrucomicrobiales bacterium BCK34]|nr:hypothetical protein [Verrucomicrobiales bacterium BCK34]
MNEEIAPADMPVWAIILIPLAFFIIFPCFWCFIMWINSHVSGWNRLAKYYRSEETPSGKTWTGVQGMVGLVSYRGVLTCTTNESGLFIQPGLLFKFAHPLLFIPWSEFHGARKASIFWFQYVSAHIGDPCRGRLKLAANIFEQSEGKAILP